MKTFNPSILFRVCFVALLLAMTCGMTSSQEITQPLEDGGTVFTNGIQDANNGLAYWLNEKTISKKYIEPPTVLANKHETAFDMDILCDEQIKKYEAQLESQYRFLEKQVKRSVSFKSARKFLDIAKNVRYGLRKLYDLYPREQLKYLIKILSVGIEIAEKILKLFH